jgi:hypothetical protein
VQCFFIGCLYRNFRWRSNYQEGGGWDVIDQPVPPTTFFVPVLTQNLDFQRPMSWSSLYSMI